MPSYEQTGLKEARDTPLLPCGMMDGSVISLPQPHQCPIATYLDQTISLCDRASAFLNNSLDLLDGNHRPGENIQFSPRSIDTVIDDNQTLEHRSQSKPEDDTREWTINFKKTWLYAGSRLRLKEFPFKVYLPTWPIICRAANASADVYIRALCRQNEKEDFIPADWLKGTKAVVLKSITLDESNCIVLAIRGSKWSIADWMTNFRQAPSQPDGFLDDDGNACHAGFLQVARAMIKPVAARLRDLLEQNPSRMSGSLLLTGHSAGGAVASLMYMHMLSTSVESELNTLTGCFKRIHCITFGAPPISLLPLQKPRAKRFEKSLFLGFANEGDPVVRADREYLYVLARVLIAPPPDIHAAQRQGPRGGQATQRASSQNSSSTSLPLNPPNLVVPRGILSNAGRLVLIRTKPADANSVEAVGIDDDQLRGVLFGDPAMHAMNLYKRRIEELATAAVTGKNVQ